jgi:hypothetical protein
MPARAEEHLTWQFIAWGKPMQNGFCDSLTAGSEMSLSMKNCSFASIAPELALLIGRLATGSVRIRR